MGIPQLSRASTPSLNPASFLSFSHVSIPASQSFLSTSPTSARGPPWLPPHPREFPRAHQAQLVRQPIVHREGRELHGGGEGQGPGKHKGRPHPRLPVCVRPTAQRPLPRLLPAGVQARLHGSSHVPETGQNLSDQTKPIEPTKTKNKYKTQKTNISKVGFANHCTHKLTCCVQVRMQVDLSPVAASETPAGCLHAITFTLISGNIRRFRRICEHIQSMVRSPH